MSAKPHVGVIGAGLAGLRCADILARNGARVTILEARDRIGGRIHQQELGAHLVDLGPNWIHGSGDNPIMAIAEATRTLAHDPEGDNIAISRDGNLIPDDVAIRVAEFVWTTIGEAFEYSNRHGDSIPPERSLFDFIQEKARQAHLSETEKELCLHACKLWGAYVGDPIEKQSLRFFRLEECIDGNNYFVASTYKHILEYIGKAAQTQADIHLEQPVVNIDAPIRDSRHIPHQPQISVTTATGTNYSFDEVVITCPLGWLKRNTTAMHPPLPTRLLEAITSICYGRLEKVYITFPRAFWHNIIDQTSPGNAESPLKSPVFAQFLEPSYTAHPAHIEWNQECLSLASLPAPCAQPTLLFYTYGPCATHIVQILASLTPHSAAYNETLANIFHPFYSRLPGYDPSSTDCQPSDFLATAWQLDQYAGNGSYCNFQVGLTRADEDIEALRSGVGVGHERGLWFAGEHTAPFVALGTTTGAYWSGERAAAQVCGRLGLGSVGVGVARDDSLPSALKVDSVS